MSMEYKEKYKEIFEMKKTNLLFLIENLMKEDVITFDEIASCHVKALERKNAEKENIIKEADNCIFESVFTDTIGRPADSKALQRKLEWLDKIGTHNMKGIFEYIKAQKGE